MRFKKGLFIFSIIFMLLIVFSNCSIYASSNEGPDISSGSAILIDNNTNKVLYSKNENKKMYPASTTKILTAILTIENVNLDDVVTASHEAVTSIPSGYSVAYIQVGEQLTVEQLLEMLLVHSANDAANVLAEYIGGSIESFVSMMNTKANELGLTGSHFTNTYGKHDDNHYTTANDLAKLMQYCMKNDEFRKLAGSASCAIPATNMSSSRLYSSTNELLDPQSDYYTPFVTAGKTGYTSQAKDCLVSVGFKNDIELICVVLGSDNRFSDTIDLYDYGYSNYSLKKIVNANDIIDNIEISNATNDTKSLDLLADSDLTVLIKNVDDNNYEPKVTINNDIKAPIEESSVVGTAVYSIDGIDYSVDLIASHLVVKSKLPSYVFACILILIILLGVYRVCFNNRSKKRKRKVSYKIREK